MKISVIIPYHDYPKYLIDCLTSLREQGVADLETVLVTNGQNAELLTIIGDFKDDLNIKHIVSEAAASVAVNRNIGLDHATGEYVYFLDSDDYFNQDCLSVLVGRATATDHDVISGSKKTTWYKKSAYEKIQLTQEQRAVTPVEEAQFSTELILKQHQKLTVKNLDALKQLLLETKHLTNVSVLNMLLKRDLLTAHHIRFDEDLIYHSDLHFVTAVLAVASTYVFEANAIYVKRNHNDAINMPALSQIEDENRFADFARAYQKSCALVDDQSLLYASLQHKMVDYYADVFAKNIHRSPDDSWRRDKYILVTEVLKTIEPSVLKGLTHYQKKLVKATTTKDLRKVKKIILRHLLKIRVLGLLETKSEHEINKMLYRHRFLKQQVKPNWVMFESFFGKSYSDSPKYIYEYLAKNYPNKYRFIWVLEDKRTTLPYGGKKVKRFSLKYAYYLARSKYLVFNVRQPVWLKKRKEQIFLQTWHGTPLKRLAFDQEEVTSGTPKYKMQFYKTREQWDYLIAANPFSSTTFRSCFLYENKMLETGYPRNDLLNHPDKVVIAKKIKENLKLPVDKKIILYAPTWRDDEFIERGKYSLELQLDLAKMQAELGNEYIVLLRMHYYIASSLDLTGYEDFAFNVSSYNDITELYLISDVLVTDYSSVFFDYATLRRPMLFFTYDLEKYRDMLRGFYIRMEDELPGPMLFTSDAVIEAIKHIDQLTSDYKEKYDRFYAKYCAWEDGQASQRVVETVFET